MPPTPGAVRASVSVEDISRQYYETAGYSMWITQMHVDPLELIVADDSDGKLYRVPVEMGKAGAFAFGDAQEVAIEYKDVKTPAGSKAAASMPFRWPTRDAAFAAAGVQDALADLPETMRHRADFDATPDEPDTPPEPKVERQLPPAEAIKRVASATATKTPDATPAAGSTTKDEEGSGMAVDPTKLREALGLAPDASDDDVKAATAAAFTPSPPPAPQATDSVPDPASLLAALPDNAGVIVLDKTNYETLIAKADQGVQALAMARAGERDKVLKEACRDGRFPPSKLAAYQEMWDKNPDATRNFITLLPKHSIPAELSAGLLGVEMDRNESDLAYEAVYGKGI
jgi:hypothetical protein